jgi:transposase
MASRRSGEFRREAVRLAMTSGLTRPQVAADLGVGLLTLNKWVQKHRHDDLMSGPIRPLAGERRTKHAGEVKKGKRRHDQDNRYTLAGPSYCPENRDHFTAWS